MASSDFTIGIGAGSTVNEPVTRASPSTSRGRCKTNLRGGSPQLKVFADKVVTRWHGKPAPGPSSGWGGSFSDAGSSPVAVCGRPPPRRPTIAAGNQSLRFNRLVGTAGAPGRRAAPTTAVEETNRRLVFTWPDAATSNMLRDYTRRLGNRRRCSRSRRGPALSGRASPGSVRPLLLSVRRRLGGDPCREPAALQSPLRLSRRQQRPLPPAVPQRPRNGLWLRQHAAQST